VNRTGSNPPNNPKTKVVVIIPARYDSLRLPGKALLDIAGKPMISRVVERALESRNIDRAIVATDDERIVTAVTADGYEAVMTAREHRSGTDRIAEVARSLSDVDIVVNVQGDEPMISPKTIERAVEELIAANISVGIVTTWEPIDKAEDVLDSSVVKIVVAEDDRAIYFSRSPVPFPREAERQHGSLAIALEKEPGLLAAFRKHTGLYVYRREILLAFAGWPPTKLEQTESLEQLRALEYGITIKAIQASAASIGVDTAADLDRVRHVFNEAVLQV